MQTIKKPRVVVFGCQKIAIDVIDFIRKDQEFFPDVVGVGTCDFERDKIFGDQLVSDYCQENNIPWKQFDPKVNADIIRAWNPDIIFSIYFRKILSKEIIDLPKIGCINIHPADLPRNRGPVPTYWAVRRGDLSATTTIHYIDAGMDTGDLIAAKTAPIQGLSGFEVHRLMMSIGVGLFREQYPKIMSGTNNRVKQNHTLATCNVNLNNSMRYVDWNQPAYMILNHIRAHTKPYAGSLACTANGTEITIYGAQVLNEIRASAGPGSYEMRLEGLVIQTHDLPILVTEFTGSVKKGRFIIGVPQ